MDVRMPDGTVVKNVPDGITKSQLMQKFQKFETLPEPEKMSKFRAFSRGMEETTSFGFTDELRGFGRAVGSKIRGDERAFPELLDRGISEVRNEYTQAKKDQPPATVLGEITGAFAPAFVPGGQAIAARIGSGNLKARVAKSAGAAALSSGAYGVGTADGEAGDRLAAGATFALGGGAFGAALPLAGPGIRKLSEVYKSTKRPAEDKAVSIVLKRLQKDNLDPQALDRVFRDGALIEGAGPSTTRLAEGIGQLPGEATNITEKFFESRLSGSTNRAKSAIKKSISSADDFYGTLDEIFEKGQEKAKPLYDKAYKKSVNSKEIDRILRTPAGQAALKQAATKMQNDRTLVSAPDKELAEQIKDLAGTGKIKAQRVGKGLKLRTLDYVKRSLDDMIESSQRAGEKDNARILIGLKKSLVGELDKAVPAYQKARKVSGDYLSNADALEKGREFLKSDADTLLREFKEFGETEKKMFRAGVARSVRDQIDNTFDEGNYVRRILGKEETRNKLKSVLGETEYTDLVKSLNAEDKLFKLRNQILKGSQTARRQAEMADLMNDPTETLDQIARKGIKGFGLDKFSQFIKSKYTGLNQKTAGEVAKILYETDPEEKVKILSRLNSASKSGDKQAQQALSAYTSISDAVGRKAALLTGEE
jgi:hypothetical protein